MADEDSIFDPSLKKKKKKKTGFNIDAAMTECSVPLTETPSPQENGTGNGSSMDFNDEAPEIEDCDTLGKKKTKKKKKAFNLDDLKDSLTDNKENEDGDDEGMIQVSDFNELDMDFSKQVKKKKKKPKAKVGLEDLLAEDPKDDADSKEIESGDSWNDSDRDYTYEELLSRAFNQLRERNPDMGTGEKKKFVMKPPQVLRIGSKKTAFANFSEICKLLHRIPKHLLQFLLAELGTSGSIDGNSQLIIKGRFQQKQIENVLRRYIKEYVTCHTCRSPDTILQKDARLYFLQCEQCNSRCSVAPIKSGFQAVANKQQRQAIRASKN